MCLLPGALTLPSKQRMEPSNQSRICLVLPGIHQNSPAALVFTCTNKLSVSYHTPSTEGSWLRILSIKVSLALKQGSCVQTIYLPTQNGPWPWVNFLGRPVVTITLVNVTENSNGSLTPTMSLPGFFPRHVRMCWCRDQGACPEWVLRKLTSHWWVTARHGCHYSFYVALKHLELSERQKLAAQIWILQHRYE